ncbi:MAG: hypothetical protein LBQ59_04345 [Candidatus Peribacteria bacterium]|nr:hypothetical protein [Candidatus Peribacteria bacterium]
MYAKERFHEYICKDYSYYYNNTCDSTVTRELNIYSDYVLSNTTITRIGDFSVFIDDELEKYKNTYKNNKFTMK